jgi:hypothetical protein
MKKILVRVLLLIVVLINGCKNTEGPYSMYTKINTDGSCYREFIRSADSAFVAGDTSKNPFPFKMDTTWKLSYYKRLAGDHSRYANLPAGVVYKDSRDSSYSWFVTATKQFPSVVNMAETFSFNNSKWDSLKTRVEFKRKFRWFYTYYEFSETFLPVNPLKLVPVSQFLTQSEIAALYGENRELFTGKNGYEIKSLLDDLGSKADKWLNKSIYEEVYGLYVKHYDVFKNPPVDVQAFAMEKDTIYKYSNKDDDLLKGDFSEVLDRHFHTNVYSKASNEEFDKELEKEFPDFLKYADMDLTYKMTLPGKIIETNAPFLNQDTLSWNLTNDRFYFTD